MMKAAAEYLSRTELQFDVQRPLAFDLNLHLGRNRNGLFTYS